MGGSPGLHKCFVYGKRLELFNSKFIFLLRVQE